MPEGRGLYCGAACVHSSIPFSLGSYSAALDKSHLVFQPRGNTGVGGWWQAGKTYLGLLGDGAVL